MPIDRKNKNVSDIVQQKKRMLINELKQLRHDKALSQEELAKRLGVAQTRIAQLEGGRTSLSALLVVVELVKADEYPFANKKEAIDSIGNGELVEADTNIMETLADEDEGSATWSWG